MMLGNYLGMRELDLLARLFSLTKKTLRRHCGSSENIHYESRDAIHNVNYARD